MNRSKHQSPETRDRHPQRNRFMDPRGLPKKEGAGQHNWGRITDELEELDEYNSEMPKYNKEKIQNTEAAEANRDIGNLRKIQVVKPEEFEALHHITNNE